MGSPNRRHDLDFNMSCFMEWKVAVIVSSIGMAVHKEMDAIDCDDETR